MMKHQAVNPYLPGWEYVPDGEPHLFDGRIYIYGSHDEARGKRYCTGDYVCWSAPVNDLTSWRFEGVIFRRTDDPAYIENPPYLFAPDVARGPDGRYYLYYFSSMIEKIGVAVSDTPEGPYHYYGDVRFANGIVLSGELDYGLPFDPGILSDESGNWLYYGAALQKRAKGSPEAGYQGGFVVELADDMLTIKDTPTKTIPEKMDADGTDFEGHAFLEASSIRHYGNTFYLVYSSENGHELCYATSKFPDRGFVYGGVIISNGDVGLHSQNEEDAVYYLGNNHGGLVQVKNQYYIFYHRHTHGAQYSRQGCAEPIQFLPDGSIPQVEITSCGLNGGPLRAKGEYSAHIACYLRSKEGIQHYSKRVHWNEAHPYISQDYEDHAATLQNQFIFNLRDGAVCGYKYFQFNGTEQRICLRLRGQLQGCIIVRADAPDGVPLAQVMFNGSENWKWIEAKWDSICGTHALYFEIYGNNSCDFDAFRIE